MTASTGARIAIAVEFAALFRCLGEFFRLKHLLGAQFAAARYEPFVIGSLVAATGALVSVYCALAWGRHRTAIGIAIVDVLLLLVVKFAML